MTDPLFRRSVAPLNASTIAYLRSWVDSPSGMPAPPYVGASPPSPEQTRLLLSSTYGAGLRVVELAATRIDAFLDEDGRPGERVRIVRGTTRTKSSRTVLMHPDVRRDVLAFREKHPNEEFVAFIPKKEGGSRFRHMHPHGLAVWFSQLYRAAGLDGLTGQSGRLFFNACERSVQHA